MITTDGDWEDHADREERERRELRDREDRADELTYLRERDEILSALEDAGVDNWEGYSVAMRTLCDDDDEEDDE